MPDGKRKRRSSPDEAKRRWYAFHRSRRFRRRFWLAAGEPERPATIPLLSALWPSDAPTEAIV